VLAAAAKEFAGTSAEVLVTVAECDLAVAGGDVEGALKRLRKVTAESAQYARDR